jgi:hypothetical protein
MKFEEFDLSKNADGLLPVVVQDATTLSSGIRQLC